MPLIPTALFTLVARNIEIGLSARVSLIIHRVHALSLRKYAVSYHGGVRLDDRV
jgi:hypothetical protein